MYKFQLPPTAHPVQLLNINENDGEIQFNQKVVNDLFMNPKLSDANVVIFSIVGAFRKGKSFLLNYVLRYLYANYESVSNANLINPDDWLGDAKEPLTGFSWKSGTDRETTGLVLWSDVFLFVAPNGEKIAIYLMDTQGLFDNRTITNDNSRIFSLSTLISSVQIFNLFNNIQEDQLQYLQFATELARYASESKINSKSFQNLLILIRDWNNPDEHSFGVLGGNQYLNSFLEVKDHQKPELQSVRSYLRSAFESINCFLMPHPGKTVARDSKYDGNWEQMDEDFLKSMKELVPELLSPNKLKTKIVNGKAIKPAELLIFIKTYIEHFTSGKVPAAKSIYKATLDKQFQILIAKSVDTYIDFVKKFTEKETYFTELYNENNINDIHNKAKVETLSYFGAERKFGTSSEESEFKKELKNKVEAIFEQWKGVAIININKIAAEKEKTEYQLRQRDLAQEKNNLAQAELDETARKVEEANYKLNLARQETEAIRREHEKLKVELKQTEEARVAAFSKESSYEISNENAKFKAQFEDAIKNIDASLNQTTAKAENFDSITREALAASNIAGANYQKTLEELNQLKSEVAAQEKNLKNYTENAKNEVQNNLNDQQSEGGFEGIMKSIVVAANAVVGVFKAFKKLFD